MATVIKHPVVTGIRRLFLLVSPNETSFERLEEVPDYVEKTVPFFIASILLEWTIFLLRGQKIRFNDSFGSLSNGLLSLLHSLLFRSTELAGFLWVHNNYNLVTLPWDSPWTWVLTLLGVDFAYYWVHRYGHEINIIWAGHQTHHSSEEYNVTTALRQSALQRYYSWIFYLPLALFLPPSIFLVHTQFNLIYQFWVHTEAVGKLGPLEWVLSTPSHHRVHHGRNPYCIDKNYGGVFIIWDRLFGTFEAERDEEKVVYGLVHNIDSWEPLYAQLCHLIHILKTSWRMKGFGNKLSVFLKGPGWAPGKPRLGLNEEIPKVKQNPVKYDRDLPMWNAVYVWIHFIIILLIWHPGLGMNKASLSATYMSVNVVYITLSLSTFGAMYDNKSNSDVMELLRCAGFVLVSHFTSRSPVPVFVYWLYVASAVLWCVVLAARRLAGSQQNKKLQ